MLTASEKNPFFPVQGLPGLHIPDLCLGGQESQALPRDATCTGVGGALAVMTRYSTGSWGQGWGWSPPRALCSRAWW